MQQGERVVREIAATIVENKGESRAYRQKRTVAYCRVSTKEEEQLNSYEAQVAYYAEHIRANPDLCMVGIYADKGITGTSVKHRDEFNNMIRQCKRGKVDMIITKSVSRFARNTVDCLKYIRLLKDLGVDVYFEEQGIHSTQPGAEFYITIYGSIAQSESENISANVRWGKAQAAKEGKVAFVYKNFLGYKKGADGKPEIDEDEAKTIRYIYKRYLAGDSLRTISKKLMEQGILTPGGKTQWKTGTLRSILSNERYIGDVIINKTYVVDCISKKTKVNKGERTKYYVENNHPAIIEREMFMRVQAELGKRASKPRTSLKGKTELGRYSSKFALTELMVCGECKSPYRRCTWVKRGKRKIVWRCLNRIDFGGRYCHESPTIEENVLHAAIMDAIQELAQESGTVLDTLKTQVEIGLRLKSEDDGEETTIIRRLEDIKLEIKEMINAVSEANVDTFDGEKIQALALEQTQLQTKLEEIKEQKKQQEEIGERVTDIGEIIDGIKNRRLIYDDELVRQMLDTVVVLAKDRIKIVFKGGYEKE